MAARVEIFDQTDELICASYRDVFLGLWRTAVTIDGARRVAVPMERMATRHPGGLSLLFSMEDRCTLPDAAAREVFARDAKRHEVFTRHMALVCEGEGFKAAAFRSVLAGMQMLVRQKAPMKVCANVDEGARWVAAQRPGEIVASELSAAFAEMRRAAR